MDFELDEGQRAWREEVRAFLSENVTPELLEEVADVGLEANGPQARMFRSKVGGVGWFGLNWPKEFGGLGLDPVYQHILVNEFEYFGVAAQDLTVSSIAPMIMRHGTEQNKREFLPPIARGELMIAVGYSEPNAGTDLASLKTRAELDGDEWVINGSKIWNSFAEHATHEWLCVRTDPSEPRHRGISVIMVPIDTPGVEVRPLITWADFRTNETFFTDVRVPRTNLIGEVNKGWQYIIGALDLERGALTNAGDLRRAVDNVIACARTVLPDGSRPIENSDIRRKIAQLDADVEAATLMGLEASSILATGTIPTMAVTVEKIYASELRQRIADVAMQMLGPTGLLHRKSKGVVGDGSFEFLYRDAPLLRFAAGTNEVLRDVIAQRGLGLPSYGR